jgi:hypothetical protein
VPPRARLLCPVGTDPACSRRKPRLRLWRRYWTADVYTEVAQELANAAAAAIAAFVPRKSTGRASNVPAGGENDHDINQGACAVAQTP